MSSSNQRYADKVTIVTGGSRGIGEGIVRVFVKNGAKVVFCSIEDSEGKTLEAELNSSGPGEACFLFCDVTKEDQIKSLISNTLKKYGKIDCLINNAGAHPPPHPIDEFSSDDFRKLLELNLIAYFLTIKYALPHLRQTKGNIINISSMVAHIGQLHACTYVATKGAISAMVKALAIDEAQYEVRINAISPSVIWTPMLHEACLVSENYDAAKEGWAALQSLGRYGTPAEVGELCLYLAAEGTFITGVDIPLSGGAELNYARKTRVGDQKGDAFTN